MSRFDWPEAAEHFRAALTGRSMSGEANWAYASLYLQPLGMLVQAVEYMERAVECDPLNALYRGVLASHLTHAGLFERAIREAQAAIEIDSSNAVPRASRSVRPTWPSAAGVRQQIPYARRIG
jgi:tetratricopeptide (TPR) repeat protein